MTDKELYLIIAGFTSIVLMVVAIGWIAFMYWSRKDQKKRIKKGDDSP